MGRRLVRSYACRDLRPRNNRHTLGKDIQVCDSIFRRGRAALKVLCQCHKAHLLASTESDTMFYRHIGGIRVVGTGRLWEGYDCLLRGFTQPNNSSGI